jgi:hypothetical protein
MPQEQIIELEGRTYRLRPVRAYDGSTGFLVSMKVRMRAGFTWRTLNGHGRAGKSNVAAKLVALATGADK